MPLSNDFDKSRLEYLRKQIKNNQTVAAQFYPRYQREYNEMFPYTEGSVQNILQPQQQIINNAVPGLSDESIELSLKEKLFGLTKNQAVTDDILNILGVEQQYYYDRNFDSVTKELLRKVKMPTSPDEFSLNLKMILNQDKHRSAIEGLRNFINPPAPVQPPVPGPDANDIGQAVAAAMAAAAPAVPAPLTAAEIAQAMAAALAGAAPPAAAPLTAADIGAAIAAALAGFAPPAPVGGPPVPVPPVPAPAGPAGPAGPPVTPVKKRILSENPNPIPLKNIPIDLKTKAQELVALMSAIPKNFDAIQEKEDELGDLALSKKTYYNDLARCIKNRPSAKLTEDDLTYAEQLILQAQNRVAAKAAFNTPPKSKTPLKQKDPAQLVGYLTYLKQLINQNVKIDEDDYMTQNNTTRVPADVTTTSKEKHKQAIIQLEIDKEIQRQEQNAKQKLSTDEIDEITNEMKPILQRGLGLKQSRIIKHKQEFNSKYAIDKKLLKKNILALKYLKNANNVATFKPIEISDTLKHLVENFVMAEKKVDESVLKTLSVTERRILKRLYSFLKMDLDTNHADNFQKEFELMYSSFLAGNDNKEMKKELKEFIKIARSENILSKDEANKMLEKLST